MFVTVMLLKLVVVDPRIDWVDEPLNTTVPDPLLKVPLLVKSLETFNVDGALSVPLIVMPPKFVALDPLMLVVPVNVIVPPLLLKVPLLVQLPATLKLPEGAVNVLLLLITTLLNELTLEPDIAVVPPNVTVEDPALSVPLFTRFPLI